MILIVDNGSQYTHLIKRNCRDLDYEGEIVNNNSKFEEVVAKRQDTIEKVILSGGPGSVYVDGMGLSGVIAKKILDKEWDIPLFGICFGHQTIAYTLGANVGRGKSAEYGISEVFVDDEDRIFKDVQARFNAWVSHFDEVKELPKGFIRLAHSEVCTIEAMRHRTREIFGVQFHPEVWHTEYGERIIENFLEDPYDLGRL